MAILNEYSEEALPGYNPQAPAANEDVNPYSEAAMAKQELPLAKMNVKGAVSVNADDYAKAARIGKGLQIPSDVAARNLPAVQATANTNAINTTLDTSPKLATAFTDMEFAKKAHDDTQPLSKLEQVFQGLPTAFALSSYQMWNGMQQVFRKALPDVYPNSYPDSKHLESDFRLSQQLDAEATPQFDNTGAQMGYEGVKAFVQSAPALLAATMLSPLAGVAIFGGQAKFQAYGKYKARGATDAEASLGSNLEGGIMAGTSLLPLNYLAGKLGREGTAKFVSNFLVRDFGAIGAQSVATSAVDTAIANPNKSWQDFSDELPALLGQAAVSAAVFSGAMGGVHAVVRKSIGDTLQTGGDAIRSQALQTASDVSDTSLLKQRDSQAFKDFAQSATEGSSLDHVYINANQFAQSAEKVGLSAQELAKTLPDVAKQLPEATQLNGDIRISTADYLGHIAGSDLAPEILPHIKTAVDGKTNTELKAYYQDETANLQKIADDVVTQKAGDQAFADSGKNVETHIFNGIKDTGRYPDDVAKTQASLIRSFYETQAQDLGLSPEEVYAKYPLEVVNQTPTDGTTLDQSKRGSISFADDITQQASKIALLKDADLSTFLHESGHFFLQVSAHMASQEGAPERVTQDMASILKMFGVKDLSTWNGMSADEQRVHHEQFARAFEAYLMDGKAPKVELQGAFARFSAWLTNIYQHVSNLGVTLSPEVRGVFDRMLASRDEIKRAESIRGYASLFTTRPEGVSDADWHEYLAQGKQATADANTMMLNKSVGTMKWLSGAKSSALKQLQKHAAGLREGIKAGVTKEVEQEPIYRAETWFRKGQMTDDKGNLIEVAPEARKGAKLNTEDVKRLFPDTALDSEKLKGLRGLTSPDGMHPDAAADIFGFRSGDHLVRELLNRQPKEEVIQGTTDQRMLEQHGELSTPEAIEREAEAAIHNEARSRFMTLGLKILTKSPIPVGELQKAARLVAEKTIAAKQVKDISPKQYLVNEAKANKEALALVAKDPQGAVKAQREALLNSELYKAATKAANDETKIVQYVKRFDKPSIRDKLPGSFVEQIDSILNQFDFRQVQQPMNRGRSNLLQWAHGLRDNGYEPQIAEWLNEFTDGVHYKELSVEKLRGVYDTLRSIEATAKSFKEVMRNGQKVALDEVVKDLSAKMDQRGQKFTKEEIARPPTAGEHGIWQATTHWFGVKLRLIDADLVPQEYKINRFDMHDLDGPFRESMLDPIINGAYAKVKMSKSISDAAAKMGDSLGKEWQKSLFDTVENTTLLDPVLSEPGKPVYMKFTRGRFIGLLRHLGNESNFDKLVKGYGWNPKAVWEFALNNASAKDWKATQAHWDMFEPLWAKTEKMVRDLGGVPPPKIEAREFDTPHGKMRGGYSPIDYDPISSKLSATKGEFDLQAGDELNKPLLYRATTTSNGSLVARSQGYSDYVNLELHAADGRIRDTIHDLSYRSALLDAGKIVNDSKFREKFLLTYGPQEYQALHTWLKDIRDMYLVDPKNRGFEKAMNYSIQGVVLTGVAYRLTTVLKHASSATLKSLGYLGSGKGGEYFAARALRMATGHFHEDIKSATEMFDEIFSRHLQMDRDYKEGSRTLYEKEDWRAKNDRFGHFLVAWSDLLSAVPTAHAAYDLATSTGVPESMGGTGKPMTDADAKLYANSVVRQAHGTALEAARSNFMNAKGGKRLFGAIYGFMNNTFGQQRDMFDKAFSHGQFNNNPALVARAVATIIAPAIAAELVSTGLPKKDDNWAVWGAEAIASEVASSVAGVREAVSLIKWDNSDNDVAPMRLLKDLVKTGRDVGKEWGGHESRIIKDLANTVGGWAHIGGLGQLGKSMQYLKDVYDGKEQPETPAELVQGATIGVHHE